MILKTYNDALKLFLEKEIIAKYNLDNIEKACEYLGNPQNSFKTIHIAGTNGKGSVSKMTSQILQEAGYKVGTFIGPHLWDVRERWSINGAIIDENLFLNVMNKVVNIGFSVSFFEKATLVAFLIFKEVNVDYAVIEVGLGGRLDATNIVKPLLTTITSIGFDHEKFLGDTFEEISLEKAGIIKEGIPIITNHTNSTIEWVARENNAPVIYTQREIETNLLGSHQKKNAGIAYEIGKYLGVNEEVMKKALMNVSHPGRIDYIRPNLFIDGAHNEDGMRELTKYIKEIEKNYSKIHYCFSLKEGKDISILTNTIGIHNNFILINYENDKLSSQKDLKGQLQDKGIPFTSFTPINLVKQSEKEPSTLFVVFGSLYMIGVFLQYKS